MDTALYANLYMRVIGWVSFVWNYVCVLVKWIQEKSFNHPLSLRLKKEVAEMATSPPPQCL